MNLKTSPITAIESAKPALDNDLELLGIDKLALVNHSLHCAIKNGNVCCDHTFSNIFGLDVSFFYVIELVKNNKVIQYERGIGHLLFINDHYILKRKLPIVAGSDASNIAICYNGGVPFSPKDDEHLIVYSTLPLSYAECLAQPNSIISSIAPFCPCPIAINNNCLVGRLDDDNLSSIPISQPSFINKIIDGICDFSKQISLKTSKLDAKRLATQVLQFSPVNNPSAKEGSVIYDKNDKKLKFYNGKEWKSLVCEESR